MDGPTHFHTSEILANQARRHPEDPKAPLFAQLAQVHATLAQTALHAKNTPIRPRQDTPGHIDGEECEKWKGVINP